jgi:hypothetical protein
MLAVEAERSEWASACAGLASERVSGQVLQSVAWWWWVPLRSSEWSVVEVEAVLASAFLRLLHLLGRFERRRRLEIA